MRRILKWAGLSVGGILVVAILALVGLYLSAGSRLDKTYAIQPAPVGAPSTPAALEQGRQKAAVYCAGCHGANLAGTAFFDDPALGHIPAPNLTKGQGGVGGSYSDADWVRAIRHGVSLDGKALLVMPADASYWLSDEDLGLIIAYVKSVPPVDNDLGRYSLTPMARVLIVAGAFGNVLTAETIDHNGSRPTPPAPGVSAAYGEYIVKTTGCQTCHGAALAGGKDPNPAAPPAPSLTPASNLGKWSEADFLTAMRTRKSLFMPYEDMAHMSDDELKALWLYLTTLPAK